MNRQTVLVIFGIIYLCLGAGTGALVWAQPTQRPAILGISHVAFQVSDLTQATKFYHGLLGYKPIQIRRKTNPDNEQINFKVNDRQHISLFSGLPAGQDERMLEVALEVTNVEAMRQFLHGKGLKVPAEVSKEPGGILYFVVEDPEKHSIKFIQYLQRNSPKSFRQEALADAVSDRILHVGITVADVKKMDAFYLDLLGFSEIWRGGRPDNVTNWINMQVPNGTDYLEYMLVSGPVSRQQLGVLHHVALQVPSMQKALDVLRARVNGPESFKLEAPRIGRNNRWQLNLYDPDGTRIELMEPFPMR